MDHLDEFDDDDSGSDINSVIQRYKSILCEIRQSKPNFDHYIKQEVEECADESQISSHSQFVSFNDSKSLIFYSINEISLINGDGDKLISTS